MMSIINRLPVLALSMMLLTMAILILATYRMGKKRCATLQGPARGGEGERSHCPRASVALQCITNLRKRQTFEANSNSNLARPH